MGKTDPASVPFGPNFLHIPQRMNFGSKETSTACSFLVSKSTANRTSVAAFRLVRSLSERRARATTIGDPRQRDSERKGAELSTVRSRNTCHERWELYVGTCVLVVVVVTTGRRMRTDGPIFLGSTLRLRRCARSFVHEDRGMG